MIKQLAGKKINVGGEAGVAGAGFKPSLVAQDLIAQFSKLVEEISAQMEVINGGGERQSRLVRSDFSSDKYAQNGQGHGALPGNELMIGMGAANAHRTSEDKNRLGDTPERSENQAKSGELRQSMQGADARVDAKTNSVNGSRDAGVLGRESKGLIAKSQDDEQGSASQRQQEMDSTSDQISKDSNSGGDDRQLGAEESLRADVDPSKVNTDEYLTAPREELDSSSLIPETMMSTELGEATGAEYVDGVAPASQLNDIRSASLPAIGVSGAQSGNAREVTSGVGGAELSTTDSSDSGPAPLADDGLFQQQEQATSTSLKGAIEKVGPEIASGASGAAISGDGQGARGVRGSIGQKGGVEELADGVSAQDEQLLGALREQAGYRVQEAAANNQKLAKAIFERLSGDLGRSDMSGRSIDGVAGAVSSSAMLGDALGRLSQGEKILPRKDRVLLSQGVQLRTMERIEQALKEVERSKDGKSISIRLDPPSLGHVRTDITLNDGILYARFVPENRDVAQLLRERASELQTILKRAGFEAERVQISVSNGSLNDQGSGSEQGAGFGSSYEGQTSGEQLFQRQGYQGENGADSDKDGWRERGFEQNIRVGAGRGSSKTDDHWVA